MAGLFVLILTHKSLWPEHTNPGAQAEEKRRAERLAKEKAAADEAVAEKRVAEEATQAEIKEVAKAGHLRLELTLLRLRNARMADTCAPLAHRPCELSHICP